MPIVVSEQEPEEAPGGWPGIVGPAVGRSEDFVALVYCPDLDEEQKSVDPGHREYTFVSHFAHAVRSTIARLKLRLEDLWAPPEGPILAVGAPKGLIQIDRGGIAEIALPQLTGYATTIWGADSGDLFVAGGPIEPFILHRRQGQWQQLALPEGTAPIWHARGQSAHEVYFVGERGQISLWDGRQVSRLPTPTTRDLVSVARLDQRSMCVCGYDGTLLLGNRTGWRRVPTNTSDDLMSLAAWNGKVYFGADDSVWSFDGQSAPSHELDAPARVLSGLGDGVVFSKFIEAHLFTKGTLTKLDVTIT